MGALLVKRVYFPGVYDIALAEAPPAENVSGERWYGIYMRGEKIGYTTTSTTPAGEGYLIAERSFMRLNTLGTLHEIKTRTTTYVDQGFALKSFDFHISSGLVDFRVQGKLQGRELHLNVITGGEENQSTLHMKDIPYLWTNLRPFIAASGLEEGKKYRTFLFDPSTLSSAEMIVEVVGSETLTVDGRATKAFKLRETFKGIVVNSWLDEEGEILREESPMGLLMVKEERGKAIAAAKTTVPPPDIMVSTSIPVRKKIEEPRGTSFLKVKLSGIDHKSFDITDQRQSLSGDVLEIKREALQGRTDYPLPYSDKKFKPYLSSTLLIQSDHPSITAAADKIVSEGSSAMEAAAKISNWVYNNLEKQYTFSIPSAVEVLKIKTGDCNEHTVLFTALARAAGIPTRISTGLVYHQGSFYYHAWADVYLGGWISVDPLMNQFPADATHLKLVEGGLDKQVQLVQTMGNLKIEVLEYK